MADPGGEWTRRRFLKTGAGLWVAANLAPGLVSCADEELNPEKYLLLWVAQSMSGSVRTESGAPVSGASVSFYYTIDEAFYIPASPGGGGTTGTDGTYRLRAAQSGAPDNFWVLGVGEDRRYTVFLRLVAGKTGVGSVVVNQTFFRFPSREKPTGNLNTSQLSQNAIIKTQE